MMNLSIELDEEKSSTRKTTFCDVLGFVGIHVDFSFVWDNITYHLRITRMQAKR